MININKSQNQHKYGSFSELSKILLAIFSVLFIIPSFSSGFVIMEELLNSNSFTSFDLIRHIMNIIGGIFWATFNWMLIYSSPAVEVEEWGLRLKTFPLMTFEIKWNDIAYVRKTRWKSLFPTKYSSQQSSIVVVRKDLTFLHRFCGVVYGGHTQPSFVISPNISNYDELMKVISDGIKKSRRTILQK